MSDRALRSLLLVKPWLYSTVTGLWVLIRLGTVGVGILLQQVFDRVAGRSGLDSGTWALIAVVAGVELARLTTQFGVVVGRLEPRLQYAVTAILRTNLLRSALRHPTGSDADSNRGEALTTVGEDVEETGFFVVWSPVNVARWAFALGAVVVMVVIDPVVTAGVVVPLVLIGVVTRLAHGHYLAAREASRTAGVAVTGALREVLTASAAVQAGQAEEAVAEHVHRLDEVRRRLAVREEAFGAVQQAAIMNAGPLGTGVVLFLAVRSIREGGFTVGDLALFTFYLQLLTDTMGAFGMFLVRLQRAAVSLRRMSRQAGSPGELTRHEQVCLDGSLPQPSTESSPLPPLESLELDGLTYLHPGGRGGIRGACLDLRRGTMTVLAGRVGAGKTTLLRAMLGLLPASSGVTRWNSDALTHPGAVLIPPRCAYVPQTPHLFSGTVRDNILLGLQVPDDELARAVDAAVLGPDLETLEQGMDSLVGPRGARLSGGQVQRVAIARALVRAPDLLVLDDVSTALDEDTENLLWDRLIGPGARYRDMTVLAVSHRPAALRRADTVVLLDRGKVAAAGPLDALVTSSAEMRRMWIGPAPAAAQPG